MARKRLWQISIITSAEAEEAVAEMMHRVVQVPVCSYTDVETGLTTVRAFLEKKIGRSKEARGQLLAAGLDQIGACGLDVGPAKMSCKPVRREDWAESWKRHFKPIQIRSRLLIPPSFSNLKPPPPPPLLTLHPALSFGTC